MTDLRTREALRALVEKIESMEKPINNCIMISAVHGCPYTGPNWSAEMDEAKAALLASPAVREDEKS